jgi:hypothetical protein
MAANEFVKAHGIEREGVFEQAMGECIFLRKP